MPFCGPSGARAAECKTSAGRWFADGSRHGQNSGSCSHPMREAKTSHFRSKLQQSHACRAANAMISHKIVIHHGSSDGSLAIKLILLDVSNTNLDGSLDGPSHVYKCRGSQICRRFVGPSASVKQGIRCSHRARESTKSVRRFWQLAIWLRFTRQAGIQPHSSQQNPKDACLGWSGVPPGPRCQDVE